MSTVSRGTGARRHLPGEPPWRRGEAGPRRTFMGVPGSTVTPAAPAADPVDDEPFAEPVVEPVVPPPAAPASPSAAPPVPPPVPVPAAEPKPEPEPEPEPEPAPCPAARPDPAPPAPTPDPAPSLRGIGPGPALVLASAGPALAALSLRGADAAGDGIPLVGSGDADGASAAGVLALLVPLAVGLAGVLLTRVRPASRLLLVAAGAAGLAAVRGLVDPSGAAPAGQLLGLALPWSAVLAWVASTVVLALTLTLLVRDLSGRVLPALLLAWGTCVAAALLPWPPGSALPFVVVAALVLGLLAGLAASGVGARGEPPAPRRPATLSGRGDLAAAALAGVLALLLATVSSRPEVAGRVGVAAAVLAVLGLLLAGERLGRWRSASPLEVLVRCVGGALVAVVATGVVRASVVTDAEDGVTGWRVGLAALALAATGLAALLPRPRPPQYTRETHLRVLRAVPWVVLALVVVADAVVVGGRPAPAAADPPSPTVSSTGAPSGTPSGVPATTAPPATTAEPPAASASSRASSPSTLPCGGPRPLVVRSSPTAAPGDGPWMSVASVSGTQVTIVIGSPVATGRLEVRTLVGNGAEVSYPLVAVEPGSSEQVTVLLPQSGDFTVELHDLQQTDPLQTLVISR